jgi:hypothetical protein
MCGLAENRTHRLELGCLNKYVFQAALSPKRSLGGGLQQPGQEADRGGDTRDDTDSEGVTLSQKINTTN